MTGVAGDGGVARIATTPLAILFEERGADSKRYDGYDNHQYDPTCQIHP